MLAMQNFRTVAGVEVESALGIDDNIYLNFGAFERKSPQGFKLLPCLSLLHLRLGKVKLS